MRKTPGASKAHASCGYWKHLRKFGKRLANKASRKASRKVGFFHAPKEGLCA
jgi:hypothetical protein